MTVYVPQDLQSNGIYKVLLNGKTWLESSHTSLHAFGKGYSTEASIFSDFGITHRLFDSYGGVAILF